MNPEVDEAAHLPQLVQHLVGEATIALDVRPLDLDVDRCRQAEVDDLRHDVRGQEVEGDARKRRRQLLSERPDIVGGGAMVALQRDQDVRVGGADDAGGAVHPVDGAVGEPDVVEDHVDLAGGDLTPDGRLHEVGQARGLLDAGARLRPQVEGELSTVGIREEVLAQSRREQERGCTDGQEHRDEDDAAGYQECEQSPVAEANPLEPAFERLLRAGQRISRRRRALDRRRQQVPRDRGHQRPRQEVGREHREDHRLRQRDEQVAGDPAQQEHRQEHDADAQRGHEGGHGDLLGAVQNGLEDRLAQVQIAVDVLDLHGGVVHEDADGEGEAAERHDVDGLAQQAERDDRRQDRERNGDGDDDRAPPAPEK